MGYYKSHNSPLAIPAYTYLKIEPENKRRDQISFTTLDNFVPLLYKPFEIELSKPYISVFISNEEKLPIWFCAILPQGIYTGVAVTIS